jgi:hypothetical protein
MALRDQNPNNLAFASKVDWSVAWIEILRGQVWGLIENGGGGSGGTQDLASVLLEGNAAPTAVVITDNNTQTATHGPYGFIADNNTQSIVVQANNIVSTINSDARETVLTFNQTTLGQNNVIQFPDDSGTVALDGDYLRLDGTATMAADLNNGSNKITNVSTPTADMDAANKAYVDTFVTGLSPKTAVRVATNGALSPAAIYDNGVSGVGATLTTLTTGTLTIDGVVVVANDRVLIKDQADPVQNGIYDVTVAGNVGVLYILTRALDTNQPAELVSAYTYTGNEGTDNKNKGYVQTTPATITIGSSSIVWALFNSNIYTEGTGIRITSNVIYAKLSEGVTGGQTAIGGTAANDTFTLEGSHSSDPRTTTDPAYIIKTMGPLAGASINQIYTNIPVSISSTGTSGWTVLKVPVSDTSTGTGTKNFIEFLGGAAGITSKFAVANTGTITVAAGANRFANDVQTIADANYTLQATDNETWILAPFTGTTKKITIPANTFPLGAQINIGSWGTGTVTFQAGVGVNPILSKNSALTINGKNVWVTLKQVGANEWALIGDLV